MAKLYPGVILRVIENSIAEELELVPGDKIPLCKQHALA